MLPCTKSDKEDKTPPTVLSRSPDDDDDPPSNSPVTISFSKRMDTSTINKNTFILKKDETNRVIDGKVHTSSDGKTTMFWPDENLDPGKIYIARIDRAVKDEAGNALAGSRTWSFKIKSE